MDKKNEAVYKDRVEGMIEDIQQACIKHGLNLTVHDGGIGFVDQEAKKIVAVWRPQHKLPPEK